MAWAGAREGAAQITASGTFWYAGSPMAAAMATLDVLEADNSAAMAHMQAMGSMLSDGLAAQAESHGVPIKVCGPSSMPFITFDADDATPATRPRAHAWCTAVAEGGSWLHPHHNWYLSLSHTAEDIAETLQATDGAPQAWACCAVCLQRPHRCGCGDAAAFAAVAAEHGGE